MTTPEDWLTLESKLRGEIRRLDTRISAQLTGLSGRVGEIRAVVDGHALDISILSDKLDSLDKKIDMLDKKLDRLLSLVPRGNGTAE
jgi:hypothetical protein